MRFLSSIINRYLYLFLVLMTYTSSTAQSSFKNYVQTKTYLDNAGTTFLRHIDYYDELGYVAETVDVGGNTSQTPIIAKTDYTTQMKIFRQWASIPSTGLEFLDSLTVAQGASTTYNDTAPYSENEYDDFLELASSKKPGEAWENHIVTVNRQVTPANVVNKDSVTSGGSLYDAGMYPYGLLTSTMTTDEDGRSMTVYTNMHGNTILERRAANNDTYYVYDGYGRLNYVLPPMCQQCSTSQMSKYWYKYTYDDRGRCTGKQLPGCDVVKYWYDEADRIQSEQDGYLRKKVQYRNYSYDAIGRLLLQTISPTRGEADQSNAVAVEIKNYYDDYSFRQEIGQLFPEWADSINAVYASPMVARGRLTATLQNTGDNKRYFEMYRYDTDGRMAYKLSAYHDKWMKIVHTSYNFVGDVVTEDERIYTYSNTHISFLAGRRTVNTFHSGTRLLASTTVTHTDKNNNTSTQTVCNPTYDVFGNVVADNRPGTAADMTYTYDTLHGWLKGVSSPSGFSEQLLRETATNPQYSGNIGRMLWRNTANGEQHRYDYTYDTLGRLTNSQYSSSFNGTAGRFNESVTYNPNGAIISLLRNGMKNDGTFGAIDDLTITYSGNRLLKVTDDAEALNYNGALDFYDGSDEDCEYEYDTNGGLTKDKNRGITGITYDYGHNMHQVSMVMPSVRGSIVNDYNSDGRKLLSRHSIFIPTGYGGYHRKLITDLYIDGLMLRNDTALLWKFSGGYVELNANGTPTCWNYYIADHLGSTRMVVDSNNSIKETINYYPFGSEMKMEDPALLTGGTSHPYRFTGKELDRLNSLNMYDFGARWYDVAGVPMWTSVDPLCEKYYNVSPYAYCAGDPVNAIDPEGKEPTDDEAARIAAHVYGDKEDNILTGGWRVSSRIFGISNEGGLKSQVYEKVNDDGDVTEYVYATAGTEPNDIDDWIADAAQVVGLSNQYHLSAVNARKISSQLGNEELNFVGHSLGGGEAALNSLLTFGDGKGRNAFTFNAAGVSIATKVREGGWKLAFKSEKSINAYITITDPLNNIQNRSMLLPSVNGNRKYVLPNRLNGHSIYNFY